MRKKLAAFLASAFILFTCGAAHAMTIIDRLPSETIVLKSPNKSYADWKEITRYVTEKEGMIEYIPSDQKIANWSELICIQYFDKSSIKKEASNSIEKIAELFQESTLAAYPGNKVTWRLIEKNKTDFTYEWILHKPFKDIPPQHEVCRAFLTDTGFHRIGFTRKNKEMDAEEREQWIKSLKDFVFFASLEKAKSETEALSIVNRVKDSLNLGKQFENWKEVNTFTFDSGFTIVTRVPPAYDGGYVDECLEVATMPNIYEATIDQLFEVEKKSVQGELPNPIEFSILKQSPTEMIYSYTRPRDHLQVTGIVRILLSNQGYYSISYKHGLQSELKLSEILLWKTRLEEVTIRN